MLRDRARILVVEDDVDCREAVAEFLELNGYAVSVARDGADALAALRSSALPDALLVDLKMPRMSGEQLIGALQRDPGLRALPVVAVSGAVERPCPVGAIAIVQKPFDPAELLRAVAFALREVAVGAIAQ